MNIDCMPVDHDIDQITDYTWDWSDWLTDRFSDTITDGDNSIEIFSNDASVEVVNAVHDDTTVTAIVQVSGKLGSEVHLTCRINTDGGRRMDWSILLRLVSR